MSPLTATPWLRRTTADLALFAAIGVVMAILGPFDSSEFTLERRFVYWLLCMVGGGIFGVGVDEIVRRLTRSFWPRLIAVSVIMTPLVMGVVLLVNNILARIPLTISNFTGTWFQVFVVSFAAMALRQLVWAQSPVQAPARMEDGDPTEVFRKRLSARRRAAALIAVQAEDHYLRIHTDAGDELIYARMSDALSELAGANGFRTHRSWWVAADAIEDVRWLRGRGEARLKSGLTAPISRSQAAPLRAAGWF